MLDPAVSLLYLELPSNFDRKRCSIILKGLNRQYVEQIMPNFVICIYLILAAFINRYSEGEDLCSDYLLMISVFFTFFFFGICIIVFDEVLANSICETARGILVVSSNACVTILDWIVIVKHCKRGCAFFFGTKTGVY